MSPAPIALAPALTAPATPEGYPLTTPSSGTALPADEWKQNTKLPLLFTPQKIGGLTLKNRIHVAPMCMYSVPQASAESGVPSLWHLVHYGAFALRGAALVIVEATGVTINGRLSVGCPGLWNDAQEESFKNIFSFIKSQGSLAGLQLVHSGRKSSSIIPWVKRSETGPHLAVEVATAEEGGWENVLAPSRLAHSEQYLVPLEMSLEDIEDFKEAWGSSVRRADAAGVDVIEIHAAHGNLLHLFLSPLANKRKDKYGGSLENRLRLVLEIIEISRSSLSSEKPLFIRISATDNHINGEKNEKGEYISWGLEQSKVLLAEASKRGIDLLDVSSGGIDKDQAVKLGSGYQVPLAAELKASLPSDSKVVISTVGLITTGSQAEEILQSGKADTIAVGREFLRNADLVFDWAQELDTAVNAPVQYQRAHTRLLKKAV